VVILVGGHSYTPAEWADKQRQLAHRREWDREYRQRPEVRAKALAYLRAYRAAHLEERREYNRDWMRRYRAEKRTT
jgi:hypothetical protein